jgi:quercetin dioxygenase-like cupin family protein
LSVDIETNIVAAAFAHSDMEGTLAGHGVKCGREEYTSYSTDMRCILFASKTFSLEILFTGPQGRYIYVHRYGGACMKITSLERVEKCRVDMDGVKDAYKQVPLSRGDGAPNFSFRVFTLEPGGHTPFHDHAFEHLNYVISGTGSVVRADGTEERVQQGDFILVLPGERHQYRNGSARERFQFICAVPVDYE